VIFADGCYWHGCPIHLPHCKKIKQHLQQDSFITHFLEKKGWIVFRFWEHEINEDAEGCIDKVLQCIGCNLCVDRTWVKDCSQTSRSEEENCMKRGTGDKQKR